MDPPPDSSITQLLDAAAQGDASAVERLWAAIYEELHAMAKQQMAREPAGHTLQSTALVHEAFLRLMGGQNVAWSSRGHFFKAASIAMRRILVEAARRRLRLKRGGGRRRVPLADADVILDQDPAELLAIDEALVKLESVDPRKAEIVILRYFGGLTIDETAHALTLSPRTVDGEWRFARAWLHRELGRGDTGSTGPHPGVKDHGPGSLGQGPEALRGDAEEEDRETKGIP